MNLKQVLNTGWSSGPPIPVTPWILLLNIVLTYIIEFAVLYLIIRRHPIKPDLEADLILAVLLGNVISGVMGFFIYFFLLMPQ